MKWRKKTLSATNQQALLEMWEGQCKFQHVISFACFWRSEGNLRILNCVTKEAFSLGRKPFYSLQLAFGYIFLFQQNKIYYFRGKFSNLLSPSTGFLSGDIVCNTNTNVIGLDLHRIYSVPDTGLPHFKARRGLFFTRESGNFNTKALEV